ncbi:MAG: molybdopterin molybdotransferase MoeA [Gaiellaceae bacterium]
MTTLVTFEEAVRVVLERVQPLPAERVELADARGRVLAEPVHAAVDLPPFPASAMDGYALRAAETPGTFPIVFRIAAGLPAQSALARGEAMAIATGGAVPEGADAVVPIEVVREEGDVLVVPDAVEAGANVRPRGGDVAAGSEVVPAGVRLGAAQVGAVGAAGLREVTCAKRPRVAVVTTGSELRPPGSQLGPGEIYESNGAMLAAQLETAGAEVLTPTVARDDDDAHREAIERGLVLDVLITSGGVSVGPHDLVRRIEGELGVEEVFWGVAVKPGKPLSFGVRGTTLVFGLPGNPVSSLVACAIFVVPAIEALQGAEPGPRFEWGRLAVDARRDPHRDVFLRSVARPSEQGESLEPVQGQESHMITRAAGANALALVRRGEGTLPAGAAVEYLRL